MAVELRGNSWGVRFQIRGKTIRKSLGRHSSREDAERFERALVQREIERKIALRTHEVKWFKPPKAPKRQNLYRHFDKDGRLLYVGISLSGLFRLLQHQSTSAWSDDIASVTIERFETREEAREAERLAIQTERPLHNIAMRQRSDG